MDTVYIDTVRLMFEVAPAVFSSGHFAMKGGTAINCFVQDMPRLSVDIDAVFASHTTPRPAALAEIATQLTRIQAELTHRGIRSELTRSGAGDETKLFASRNRIRVKLEVNHVFRGTILPVESRPLSEFAARTFATSLSVPTLAVPELYGSKLVAAMDRQHPRDLFDVHGMFNSFGLTPEIVECFVGYLAGHNRPVHEVLGSSDRDLQDLFANEFSGMAREPVSLDVLNAARARLRTELRAALTENQKTFLLGLVSGNPPWSLMRCRHLSALPAIQWKLRNLDDLERRNPAKFNLQADELRRVLGA